MGLPSRVSSVIRDPAEASGAIPVGLATSIWSLNDLREVCVDKQKGLFFESLEDTDGVLKALELL